MIAPARLPEPAPYRLALRRDEAADAAALSVRTLMDLVERNEIPYCRIGKRNLEIPSSRPAKVARQQDDLAGRNGRGRTRTTGRYPR